jgi:(p)ppGpp synthase/HD superfamily hydrolase
MSLVEDAQQNHAKRLMAMRQWLAGGKMMMPLKALEYGARHHPGLRKNGIDPYFSHQVFIMEYIQTIHEILMKPHETLAAASLHDTPEDRGFGHEEIEKLFGREVSEAVRLLTKKHRGVVIPYETYFANMATDPIASVVKAVDRLHNISSMHNAGWSIEKQAEYLVEVDRWFLPMLREARDNFPEQRDAYLNLKTVLCLQRDQIRVGLSHQIEIRDLRTQIEAGFETGMEIDVDDHPVPTPQFRL